MGQAVTDARQVLVDKMAAASALVEEVRQELFAPQPPAKADTQAPAPTYQFHIQTLTIHASSTASLERIMTDLTSSIATLSATLDATSVKLDKVIDEYVTTVADLTDQLAAAVAKGAITPELIASVEAAQAKANVLAGKADALDALQPDA
jgi:hypothetical protein